MTHETVEVPTELWDELRELLNDMSKQPAPDRAYNRIAIEIGRRVGFGRAMCALQAGWQAVEEKGGNPGTQFVVGPCALTVTDLLNRMRAATRSGT